MIIRAITLTTALALGGVVYAQDVPKPWSMADEYYDKAEMETARQDVQKSHGGMNGFMIMGDRLELQFKDSQEHGLWDAQAWYGGDYNKLFVKTEGEYSFSDGEVEDAEVQALWSRAIASFWDVQAGLRYDIEPKGRVHAVIGMQGLAPLWFEVDAAAFVSTDGDISARIEAEYDYRFTQRLILQPRVEVELSANDIPLLGVESGLTGANIGARLRYDIKREFAPYAGLEWQGTYGADDDDTIVAVIGLRTWY